MNRASRSVTSRDVKNVAGLRGGGRDAGARPADARPVVAQRVRVAAAKARVSADRKRGVSTEGWIVDLANSTP